MIQRIQPGFHTAVGFLAGEEPVEPEVSRVVGELGNVRRLLPLRVLGTEDALGAALNWYRANVGGRQIMAGPVGSTTVPTLFIWSDGDATVCREGAEATEQFVAAPYRFEILEGVSHWVPELASDAVNRFLIEHLREH